MKIIFLVFCIYITLWNIFIEIAQGTAANIRVGQLLGSNKPDEAKNAAKVSYVLIGMSYEWNFIKESFIIQRRIFTIAIEAVTIVAFLFFGSELVIKIFDRNP